MFKLENLVRKNILDLEPYSSARSEYTDAKGIFLDANENPFGAWNRYPDPVQHKLKQKISEVKGIEQERIFIGNGSDEIIDLAVRIFCVPGLDKVLSFTPTYGMYNVSAAINNVVMLEVPLDKDFQLDKYGLDDALSTPNLKIAFLCSPNNPSGNSLDALDLVLKKFTGIVIIDEAYIDFADQPSMIKKLSEYPQLIITQTLSKAWGLASARIGIAYASAAIIALFTKMKPPYNVSTFNQEAAIKALSDLDTYDRNLAVLLREKETIKGQLLMSSLVIKIYPSDANFLLVETSDPARFYNGLLTRGIVIRNRSKEIANCVRISIGTPEENKKLIDAVSKLSSTTL